MMQKKEPVDPEEVKISRFDTQCDRVEWYIWRIHLTASQGKVSAVNIYK